MKKISWADYARNEEVLQNVEEERNILQTTRKKANWISHILNRSCLLKGNIQEWIEEM
jgi:replicative superfamily II helicase